MSTFLQVLVLEMILPRMVIQVVDLTVSTVMGMEYVISVKDLENPDHYNVFIVMGVEIVLLAMEKTEFAILMSVLVLLKRKSIVFIVIVVEIALLAMDLERMGCWNASIVMVPDYVISVKMTNYPKPYEDFFFYSFSNNQLLFRS